MSDGTAAVLMMKQAEAEGYSLQPLDSPIALSVAGVDLAVTGIGPVAAIPKVLEKPGLRIDDIDLFEVNEVFGSQADYCIRELGLNRDIVNVNRSNCYRSSAWNNGTSKRYFILA